MVTLEKLEKARQELIKPGGKERADYYNRVSEALAERQQELQDLNRLRQALLKLQAEASRYAVEVFPQLVVDLKRVHREVALTAEEWGSFLPTFTGNPEALLSTKLAAEDAHIKAVEERSKTEPTASLTPEELRTCALDALKAEREKVGELIGVDQKNVQRLKQLNDAHATTETKRRRLAEELVRAEASSERLRESLRERGELYGRFFELVIEQLNILQELYAPLEGVLAASGSSAKKLSLKVVRTVDVDAWADAGEEQLLDLRKNGKFRGRGALASVAREVLLPAWRGGSAPHVVAAMEQFRSEHDESLLMQASVERGTPEYQQWIVDLGRWLYSTDHVKVEYEIEYEGVPITQLSPGTRGIVMLLLYLALDLEDSRPFLIDQPEENLDPRSVFSELVALFRQARLRRQVIIVTHNANLVVNTDVDQVIIASCVKTGGGAPPEFHYQTGGLEDPSIRQQVCDILEGGEAAFKQRARRLRVAMG